jgi:hypothetical protein
MMTRHDASDLAYRLGRQAEAVCRHYLSAGKRNGNYWQVGDARNKPGRSMFVRLTDTPKGPAGKFVDPATGEHGDLLDIIREALGLRRFADVRQEAMRFLSMPQSKPPRQVPSQSNKRSSPPAQPRSVEAARRLFAMSQPIQGTLVARYLRTRGILALQGAPSLRYHPRCYHRPDDGPTQTWPAMIAAVTDLAGQVTGAHRTWLASDGSDKAPIELQRKAMGDLLGHAVRFGVPGEVMAAGEGIENVLSVREVLPGLAGAAALSATHLAAILFPDTLRRLYIIRDNDPAGDWASDSLVERAVAAGIEAIVLSPQLSDFNDDLRTLGVAALRDNLRKCLVPQDTARLLDLVA